MAARDVMEPKSFIYTNVRLRMRRMLYTHIYPFAAEESSKDEATSTIGGLFDLIKNCHC